MEKLWLVISDPDTGYEKRLKYCASASGTFYILKLSQILVPCIENTFLIFWSKIVSIQKIDLKNMKLLTVS